MNAEAQAYWNRILTRLVDAVGVDDARSITDEVARRMGDGGTSREWTAMLLRVCRERGANWRAVL